MRKTIRNIVLIAVALFVCNVGSVTAKDIAKTCKYNTPSSVVNENQTSVLCNIYTDDSHQCYMQVGGKEATTSSNKESIQNWTRKAYNFKASDYYKETGNCPEYLTAIIDVCVGCYEIFGFNDYSEAEAYKTERGKYYTVVITNLNKGGTNAEQQLDDIINSIIQIKKDYSFADYGDTTVPSCIYDGAPAPLDNAKDACKPLIETSLTSLINYQNQVQSLIDSGEISASSEKILTFNQILEETKSFFDEELEDLENMITALENGKSFADAVKIYHGDVVKPGENTGTETEERCDRTTCVVFGCETTDLLEQIIDWIQIAIPVIIIVMTIVDFIGVAVSGEEKNFKAAGSKFIKRLLIGIAFILLPMLLTFIIDFSGALEPYGIERNQLFCSLF